MGLIRKGYSCYSLLSGTYSFSDLNVENGIECNKMGIGAYYDKYCILAVEWVLCGMNQLLLGVSYVDLVKASIRIGGERLSLYL